MPKKRKKKEKGLAELLMDENLRKTLVKLGGENTLPVLVALEKKPHTDESLAELLNLRVNDVRAVLNKLHPYGIVMYERTRSEDGWYHYTWYLKKHKILKILADLQEERKEGEFYCPSCGMHYDFDSAFDNSFVCPECGEALLSTEVKEWVKKSTRTLSPSRRRKKSS